MKYNMLLLEEKDDIAIVSINRPKVYNALNREVLEELDKAITYIENNADIHAFIITGVGPKAFVSGADINELNGINSSDGTKWMLEGQRIFARIERSDKPSIAAVNGYCLGGGNELAMACDIRFASENAKFGQPEIKLGNIPGWGGTQRLPRLIGLSRAKQMVLSGEFISAKEAYDYGLVNKVLPDQESLLEESIRLAHVIASRGSISIAYAKKAINYSQETSLDAGLSLEAFGVGLCLSTDDQTEGVNAFIEKREPHFKGK
ncbi:enoyl-CoA hydratase-related protein [Paratissierella segnis]|jgi:enoyl-CoA hydratase|uniref:Enoyl-CoA hydratase/isomerase family protein n=1 Tax=Paratissierella segnis TaxID=2763679 RepID=A0A926ET81_9FIRM|nr:enoyl-CoA hydratase-related protein [Paratissierella segnis]MBC8587798.1 enoyl-CoA hydratase/isomerase family protein [Paratissierella segnis]